MPAGLIRNIIFDFGGVLIDWNPHYLYRKLLGDDPAAINAFLEEIGFYTLIRRGDRGEPFARLVAEVTEKHPHRGVLFQAFVERFPETLSGPISESVALLEELSCKQVPLYGLTNWASEMFYRVRSSFPFLDLLQGIVVSGDEGIMKPEPEIYRLALSRFGLEASETLFIDDVAANVQGARDVGMHAHQFRSAAELRVLLREHELL